MPSTLSVFSWNVQSPGEFGGSAELNVIAGHLATFRGHDIYAFCEVLDESWADRIRETLEQSEGDEFVSIMGTTGRDDRIAVCIRATTLRMYAAHEELTHLKEGGGRAPLILPLELMATGMRFKFVMNHLHSTATEKRLAQVDGLNAWARGEPGPLVMAGDYNFFDILASDAEASDEGLRRLTRDDVFRWVRPESLVPTQFDPNDPADWILDYVFVGGEAKSWRGRSKILLADQPRDYFLSREMADHRPVAAQFEV